MWSEGIGGVVSKHGLIIGQANNKQVSWHAGVTQYDHVDKHSQINAHHSN